MASQDVGFIVPEIMAHSQRMPTIGTKGFRIFVISRYSTSPLPSLRGRVRHHTLMLSQALSSVGLER